LFWLSCELQLGFVGLPRRRSPNEELADEADVYRRTAPSFLKHEAEDELSELSDSADFCTLFHYLRGYTIGSPVRPR